MHTLVQGGLLANRQFTDFANNLKLMVLCWRRRGRVPPVSVQLWPPHSPDINPCDFFLWGFLKEKVFQRRPENVAQLRAHIVKLCRALSEDLCRKVMTNARVRLQEVVRQNGGHIEHVLHYEQFSSL